MQQGDLGSPEMTAPGDGRPAPPRRDRITATLTVLVLVAVIASLTLVIYIVYAGLLGDGAPRTAVERDLFVLEAVVEQDPTDADRWADYIEALSGAGLVSSARAALDDARANFEEEQSLLVLQEARILWLEGDAEGALEMTDEAMDLGGEEADRQEAEMAERGTLFEVERRSVREGAILAGTILAEQGRWDEAVEMYGVALEEDPTMADILVRRGDAYLELSRAADAAADYEAALEFVPDYEDALEGLERAGELG